MKSTGRLVAILLLLTVFFIRMASELLGYGVGINRYFVLLLGIINKKAMMKQFFGSQFFLNDETWFKLSFRWGMFFLFLTIINELAWRNLITEDWIFVKVFVLTPLIGLFMLAQLPITLKGRIKKK